MEGGREEEEVGGKVPGPRSGSHQLTAAVLGGAPRPRRRSPCQQQAQQDGSEAGGGHLSIPTAGRQEGSAGNTGGQHLLCGAFTGSRRVSELSTFQLLFWSPDVERARPAVGLRAELHPAAGCSSHDTDFSLITSNQL